MQRRPPVKIAAMARDNLLGGFLAMLVVVQLVAFWMLCSHQVRKAEVHNATVEMRRVAVAECLRYIPRATLNSCAHRVDPTSRPDVLMAGDGAPGARRAVMSTVVPVGFSYR
jgi:hypothetical protein